MQITFPKINRRLLPIKLHFALFNAGTACVQLTMPVFAKTLRFSSFIVGTIYTVLPLLGLVIKPVFGAIADKYKKHRTVLIAWEVITITTYFVIQYIPTPNITNPEIINRTLPLYYSATVISACSSGAGVHPYLLAESGQCKWNCPMNEEFCTKWNLTNFSSSAYYTPSLKTSCVPLPMINDFNVSKSDCEVICPRGAKLKEDDIIAEITLSDRDTFNTWQFWVFLVLLVGSWGGTAVVTTLSDTICIEICGDPHLYGKQRMLASFAWGGFSIVNGIIIDAFSYEGEEKNYTPSFYLMLVPLAIDVVLSYFLEIEMPQQSENVGSDTMKVLMKPKTLLFMFWCAMVGAAFGLQWNFLFWLLEDLAAASTGNSASVIKTIEGLVSAIQTFLGDAPAFFFGGWIVNKLGFGHSMSLVFLCLAVRFTLYSMLVNPWWCLPIDVLDWNYGIFYSCMTAYAKTIALPGTEATIQSIICAVCEGVGVAFGSLLGGYFYDIYGGSIAFRIFGLSFFVFVAVNEILEYIFKAWDKRQVKNTELKENHPKLCRPTEGTTSLAMVPGI